MATAAQAAANAANAQRSTGPTTEAGKAASSGNALKHGLTSQKTILIPGEDEAAYRKLCDETFAQWKPEHEQERGLIQILCDTQWRLGRCARLEAVVCSGEYPDFKAYDSVSKHEARLQKQYSTTLKEVTNLIAGRTAKEQEAYAEAVLLRKADRINKVETNFKAIGFDFSVEEIDWIIDRQYTLARAKNVVFPPRPSHFEAYCNHMEGKK